MTGHRLYAKLACLLVGLVVALVLHYRFAFDAGEVLFAGVLVSLGLMGMSRSDDGGGE